MGRSGRRRWFVGAGLVLTLLVLAEVFVFVRPPTTRPGPNDVVVVLGGNSWVPRLRLGLDVANRRPGSVLLLSLADPSVCPWRTYQTAIEVICFRADPATTQGEAQYATRMATERGASSIGVIASADQLLRARLRFGRCWTGNLAMLESPASTASVLKQLPYQNAAMVKALVFQRGC